MSFLIDPPLLYASGRAYAETTPERSSHTDGLVGVATMTIFWGVSISLYLDRAWTRPIWRLCRASSGRDWMLNSRVLRLDWRRVGTRTHAVSAAIFATYPVWLWLGMRDGRRRGSAADHGP
jgi:hypothetical protein